MLRAGMDIANILTVLIVADRPEDFAPNDVGETNDRVQGRPDFMAHIGQKFRFGTVRQLRPGPFTEQLLLNLFLLCNILIGAEERDELPFFVELGTTFPADETDFAIRPHDLEIAPIGLFPLTYLFSNRTDMYLIVRMDHIANRFETFCELSRIPAIDPVKRFGTFEIVRADQIAPMADIADALRHGKLLLADPQRVFDPHLFGNVGEGGDKPTTWYGFPAHVDRPAILARTQEISGRTARHRVDLPTDDCLDITLSKFTPFSGKADKAFERSPHPGQVTREID